MSDNIPKFKSLKQLDFEFLSAVKIVCVFGENEKNVLLVTKDDIVYSLGDLNENICDEPHKSVRQTRTPQPIDELCHKKIIDFAYGLYHAIAVTKTGQLYAWGGNSWGQLANGGTGGSEKWIMLDELKDKINGIACGMGHTLAVSESGQVYAWGNNEYGQLGNGDHENQVKPVKIKLPEKIVAVSAGFNHSMALTNNGQVFCWGHNLFGQLGVGSNKNLNTPTLINVGKGVMIKKICAGNDHNLLLTREGDVYTFGKNSCGQLGIGSKENKSLPVRVEVSVKFTDIAASIFNNISVAVSHYGCYVWGQCRQLRITIPTESSVKSAHEVFAEYSLRKVTYRPVCL